MGGKEASRGFYLQALYGLMKALKNNDWDEIHIEYPSEKDKIDIAFKKDKKIVKAIQVKSSINAIGKAEVIKFLRDIINDTLSKEYVLMCFGSVTNGTNILKKALDSYYEIQNDSNKEFRGVLSKESTKALKEIENLYKNKDYTIRISFAEFDLKNLKDILFSYVSRYLHEMDKISLYPEQTDLLVNAMQNKFMEISSKGVFISKESFKEQFCIWVNELAIEVASKTTKLEIQSFKDGSTEKSSLDAHIDLQKYLEGKILKEHYKWDAVNCFLLNELDKIQFKPDNINYVYLNTSMPIALVAGQYFNTKRNVLMYPVQKSVDGQKIWNIEETNLTNFQEFQYKKLELSQKSVSNGYSMIVSITHNIYDQVIEYINSEKFEIANIHHFYLDCNSGNSIKSGEHSHKLCDEIASFLTKRKLEQQKQHLHLFISAPNGFVFMLGRHFNMVKEFTVYDYDYYQSDSCTYFPTITKK